jgi:hypothetical protein
MGQYADGALIIRTLLEFPACTVPGLKLNKDFGTLELVTRPTPSKKAKSRIRVLLENLIVAQLLTNSPTFYEIQRFIIVPTRADLR